MRSLAGHAASPAKLWRSGSFEHKKLVLRLAFADHLAYCPDGGFQTPKTSMPFKLLEGVRGDIKGMAEGVGFELVLRSRGSLSDRFPIGAVENPRLGQNQN